MLRLLIVSVLILSWTPAAMSAERLFGYHASVPVRAATRIDWVFALANQSPASPPESWTDSYNSMKHPSDPV